MKTSLTLYNNLEAKAGSFMYLIWERSEFNEVYFNDLINEFAKLEIGVGKSANPLVNYFGGDLFHMMASILFSHTVANLLHTKVNGIKYYKLCKNIENSGFYDYCKELTDKYLGVYETYLVSEISQNTLNKEFLLFQKRLTEERVFDENLFKIIYNKIIKLNEEKIKSKKGDIELAYILVRMFCRICVSIFEVFIKNNRQSHIEIKGLDNLENDSLVIKLNSLMMQIHGYFNGYVMDEEVLENI